MGAQALQAALGEAGLQYADLDLLISAAGSFDHPIPHQACLIPGQMGLPPGHAPCFDVDATCLSFVTALDVATALMAAGRYRRIAIVTAEIASRSLNPADEETFTLLADGAAAAVIEAAEPGSPGSIRVLGALMRTFPQGAAFTMVPGGGNALHPIDRSLPGTAFTFHMKGREVLRMAMEQLPDFLQDLYAPLPFALAETDLIIPHQASRVGLAFFQKLAGLRQEQVWTNLEHYGNCIAASIPLGLHDAIRAGALGPGQRFALMGTAAGLSIGGLVLEWLPEN
jgi:3-oxoacyl-[acyl-carrier-protein] synthase-3